MLKRSITGFFIVAVAVGFFALRLIDIRFFNILILLMALLSCVELIKAFKEDISKLDKVLVLIYTLVSFVVITFMPKYILGFTIVYIIFAMALAILVNPAKSINSLTKMLFAFVYPIMPLFTLVALNYSGKPSFYLLVVAFASTSFTDVGAYLIGSLFKGKKLCPKISPNKTISGCIGGVLGGILATFLSYYVIRFFGFNVVGTGKLTTILLLIISGIIFSITTQIGDLFESWLKRRLEVKDMGNLMPGHGGMLDRIDGLTFTVLTTFAIYSFLI